MGLWVVWWRGEKLDVGKGIAWGDHVDEMLVIMVVVEMG